MTRSRRAIATLAREDVRHRLRVAPLLGALALVAQLAVCAASGASMSARRVSVQPEAGGGFLVEAQGYRATVGADGNLHSFRVGNTELLDDKVAISLGAFLYADAPLKLDTVTRPSATTIAAEGKDHQVEYRFLRTEIQIGLTNRGAKPVSYFVVLSPAVTVASNLVTKEEAAAPGQAKWSDVRFTTARGAHVDLLGGSRIWGPWLGHQVWEVSAVAPGERVQVKVRGGQGRPPNPTLEHLLTVRARANPPESVVPAEAPLEVQAWVENRSDGELSGVLSMQLSGCRSDVLQTATTALKLPARETTSTSFRAEVEAPDFYTARLSLTVGGKEVASSAAAAGNRVSEIRPGATRPADFEAFWQRLVAEAGSDPPPHQLARDRARSREGVTVSTVEYQGLGGKAIHGWYLCPDRPGRHPGVLYLSGYGARPVEPPISLASHGYVVLAIDVRGNRVEGPRVRPFEDYGSVGIQSAQTYVYREIVGHCLRALRLLASREEVDPERIAVVGVSEGAGLGLILSALAPEVKAAVADAPLLCDFPLSVEAGGWPYSEMARRMRSQPQRAAQMRSTLSYFDAADFAPDIRRPVLVSVGFLDRVSLPAAVYGVYNLMPGPKEMKALPEVGHEGGGEELWAYKLAWLEKALAPQAPPGGSE